MRDLTPEVIKTLTADQLELLVELGDLAKTEEELTEKIETIRRQEEKVGLARNNRVSKAVHEDQEFVDLLSIRALKERTAIRDKIAAIIKALISAGLADLAIIKRQASNYGIKLE
jgi:hypothetical protein